MKLVVAAAHRKGLSWPLRNLLLPVAVLALIVIGWCSVYLQSRTIINANIAAYQQTQLEIVRAVARSIEAYLKLSIISPDPADIAAMEQEIFVHFVAPVHLLEQGDAWIYAPSHVVFDKSVDFPIEYQGKSMAEIFAMQRAHGASNYEEMAAAVMAAEEGVGWYIWLPEKGREIAAWTPVEVKGLTWTIGLSTPLPEIMAATGATSQIRATMLLTASGTLLALLLLLAWVLSSHRHNNTVIALHTSEEALRLAQKSESLGTLAAGIAHDFNNLLTAISGHVELIRFKLPKNHHVQRHVEQAFKATRRAADLTGNLLAYAGHSPSRIVAIELNALIQENLLFFRAALPKNVLLTAHTVPDLPLIDGDQGEVQQLLMNLLINAAEATSTNGGEVVITTTLANITERDRHCWLYTNQPLTPGVHVVLEVRDNGCGMDATTLAKIFDPFFTTKLTGRGLGLASVIGIIRGHRAGLSVESTPGSGTTFRILFPISTTNSQAIRAPEMIHTLPLLPKHTVLVIDDEEQVRSTLCDTLTMSGLSVVEATNGQQGLETYRKLWRQIELILLDLSMPGPSTAETLTQLHEINPHVPILLLSGYGEDSVEPFLQQTTIAGFLQKPYEVRQLIHEIQQHLH